uniref:Magnesium transporter n=1 Tax=Ananas comosus var. bracteatus TaxID=296719 RepID=A0A6V7Q6P0_ANACO|nr:unnamed protein product [Ananas comosus var. bracteatus]
MSRTGLPARDLRVLDPLLSYPSTILGRERAIVINLEHIKAIITAAEVLIPNSRDPSSPPSSAISNPASPPLATLLRRAWRCGWGDMGKAVSCWPSFPGSNGATSHVAKITKKNVPLTVETPEGNDTPTIGIHKDGSKHVLPFEFRVLEVCLESACRCLEAETLTLEQEAYPALDELTSKISTLNLERVRQIKSRLVALSGRVQKVRDELEHLLDDDMDMAEMYLTEKLSNQTLGESSLREEVDGDSFHLDEDDEGDVRSETGTSRGSLAGYKPNIEELEMLLEAYFVQIDGTLNKLSHLREYVDDTEDYINIMLDEKQNQLLQMGVMLTTATVVLTAGVVVVGLFGMNITIDLYNSPNQFKFWETTIGTIVGCIVLYILAIGWGKKSGLLQ